MLLDIQKMIACKWLKKKLKYFEGYQNLHVNLYNLLVVHQVHLV